MEKIFKIFTKEYANLNQAAILLGFFAFLSQVLALFRDRFIAYFIGPSPLLDAYYAAFRIPDLVFICMASLASVTVIIPFIVSRMSTNSDGSFEVTNKAQKYFNDIFTVFLSMMIIVSMLAFLLMPYLVYIIAPGFDKVMQAKVIILSRIMLLSPILMGLSNLFGTVTQLFRKFFIYSLSPIFYNIGIIIGIVFFYSLFGVYGLAYGVVLGAFMHFLIQFLSSTDCGFVPKFSFNIDFKDIKKAVLISLPRTLGLSMNSIALISIISMASYLKGGSISIFNLSFNLQSVPLNIIGMSYAVAAFPSLAKSISFGKMDEFRNHLKSAGRSIVFWSLPVTFLSIVLRAQIVRVILGSPTFSWENTRLVAASLAIFSISVMAQGMTALLSRAYYAKGDTVRPLSVNFVSSILIVILSFVFINLFHDFIIFRYFIESMLKVVDIEGTEVLMLPLAYSVGTIINFMLHLFFVKRDFMNKESFINKTFFQSLGASFILSLVSYLSLNILSPIFGTTTFLGVFLQGFIAGMFGIMVAVLVLYLLKSEELMELIKTLRTKFWKVKIIPPSQEVL
jgi:putative peptidoglycan lipid II flippase